MHVLGYDSRRFSVTVRIESARNPEFVPPLGPTLSPSSHGSSSDLRLSLSCVGLDERGAHRVGLGDSPCTREQPELPPLLLWTRTHHSPSCPCPGTAGLFQVWPG